MKLVLKLLLVGVVVFFTSCVKELDFNQADQLELTPAYSVSLVNFEVPQTLLINPVTGVEQVSITDKSDFLVFNNSVAQENLDRVVFNIEISNPFDRDFNLTLRLLDENDVETYQPIVLNVEANNTDFKHEEVILLANNSDVLNSEQIETTIELTPSNGGSMIDINDPKILTFKSAGTFYFRIN